VIELMSKRLGELVTADSVHERTLAEQPDRGEAHRERCEILVRNDQWAALPSEVEAGLSHLRSDMVERFARQATKREQWPEALALWRLVARRGLADVSLRRLVNAQLDCAAKLELAACHPEIPTSGTSGSSSDPLTCARRPRTGNRDPRHIVIAGIPFCGSTLLGLVLGGLPGIANVGESHWLVEKRVQRTSAEPPLTSDGYEQCMSCGAACSIVTADLRNRLADAAADFYGTLGAAYAVDTVLTSDKYYDHILRLDPALHNDAIVLFRHPMANWESHCVRHSSGASPDGQRKYLKKWGDVYTAFLQYFDNRGRKIFVDFDAFATNPEQGLMSISMQLSLPFAPEALAYWRTRQHYVGGNMRLALRRRAHDENELGIKPRPPRPNVKPAPEAEGEFARALNVWERLQQNQTRSLEG
jgi:hypothetical protein